MPFRLLLAAALAALLTTPADAQSSLTLGVRGADDGDTPEETELYYRRITDVAAPFGTRVVWGASVTDEGAVWAGVGLAKTWIDTPGGLSVTTSLMPGLYEEGGGFDLGHVVEFRSGIEIGYAFENGGRISFVVDHLSNAGLDDRNPGSNMVGLRYTFRH